MNLIYITIENKEKALKLANYLVEHNIIACANIIESVTSVYKYKDQINQEQEAVIIAKTSDKKIDHAISEIKKLHEYECPCIISWSINKANEDFLKWVDKK